MAPCISETIAWNDFLHTSGKWPASLTIPPRWPPMPSAQVLQAFFVRIAANSRRQPTRLAMRSVYRIAAQPPPLVIRFMGRDRLAFRVGPLHGSTRLPRGLFLG